MTPQYYLAELAKPSECEVRVSKADFEAALRELVPSVSQQEMEHYKQVRLKFEKPEEAKTRPSIDGGADTTTSVDNEGYTLKFEEEELPADVQRFAAANGNLQQLLQDVTNGHHEKRTEEPSEEVSSLPTKGSAKKNKGKGKAKANS
jgi:peroxin-6